MNSSKGIEPQEELKILHQFGLSNPTQHPKGGTGPDAIVGDTFYEVRGKAWDRATCRKAHGETPAGVLINVCEVEWHRRNGGKPFVFLVEFLEEDAQYLGRRLLKVGGRALIDPLTAQERYARGPGRDVECTGKQQVYGIPVEDFETIYSIRA